MQIDLSAKTILVTGASRGIGAAIATTLHQAGATVILHYGRDREAALQVGQTFNSDRWRAIGAELDQPQAAQTLWDQAIAVTGQIDVVVNNAAMMAAAGVTDDWSIWDQVWTDTLQVNVRAVADLCRLAIAHYQTRSGGMLINLASRAAFRGDGPEYMHYAASKGAIVALTRTIARGFAAEGILAYAIAPGFVHTDRIDQVMQTRGRDYVTRDIPLGAPAPPQEVANLVAFLAAGLATHATGATFDINGASYMR